MAEDPTPLSLDILWFLAHAPEPVTLAEIVSGTGHSRTTVDRTLTRLCDAGWVSQEGRPRRFTPGMRVASMGMAILRLNRVRELALRHARELAQNARNSVGVSFYDGGEVIFTDHVELRGEHFVQDVIGIGFPAPSWASGNILLACQAEEEIERVVRRMPSGTLPFGFANADAFIADLSACRERGYVLRAHHEQQIAGLAVPALDGSGRAIFALSLTLLLPVDEATVSRLVPVARTVALRASAELQNHPHRTPLIA
jgi:DNA-binding IclR family transcriptional regulator